MRASLGTYLDSASGAPLHPRVIAGLSEALQAFHPFANPNSLHQPAQAVSRLARETSKLVLDSLGLSSSRYKVLFTSSATEAVQTAVRSTLNEKAGKSWFVSAVEHSCNRDLIPEMKERGVNVVTVPVSRAGKSNWEELAPTQGGGLLSLLSVQNETGVTSHILSASAFSKTHSLKLCIDHVAGWGKIDLPFLEIEPEFIAVSGHKIGAPAGIAALIYRNDQKMTALVPGSQQSRLRGGTENSLGILCLKLALEAKALDPSARERVLALRDRFESEILIRAREWNLNPVVTINGRDAARSPYVSSVTFGGMTKGLDLPLKLDLEGIYVSSGSACQSAVPKPSPILLHYGLNEIDARNTLRISLHDHSEWNDLERLMIALERIFARVK